MKAYNVSEDVLPLVNSLCSDGEFLCGGGFARLIGKGSVAERFSAQRPYYIVIAVPESVSNTSEVFAEFDRGEYPSTGADYFEIISDWVADLHGWKVPAEHFRYVPGIVKGFGFAQRCFLKPGDKVIIQKPVYHPFRIVTEMSGFEVVNNPLRPVYDAEGFLQRYEMDLEDLERKIDDR
ncbi:MAG: aminotransferase class I/II-fold pyridoxal phosphate-dependent enzyme, partial [Clostridia bacterium]|nr:aminotransferase class I/II-fold pyridoxal phosphate-dependent enzyme [Clostridia bacterium]